jgi:hypothetical protein
VRVFHAPGRGREISRSGATHFCQQRQNYFLFAAGGPISFSSERNGGKNAAQNPWFLDFLPPLAAVFWFVRNVEMTYFSERCRFYSEMRRCAVLHFGRSAAAGTEADQFHISGGLHFAAFARDAERQAHMCGARADFQTAGLNGVSGTFGAGAKSDPRPQARNGPLPPEEKTNTRHSQ